MKDDARRLWLIDASYLLKAQRSVAADYQFDYRKLRLKLEEAELNVRASYARA